MDPCLCDCYTFHTFDLFIPNFVFGIRLNCEIFTMILNIHRQYINIAPSSSFPFATRYSKKFNQILVEVLRLQYCLCQYVGGNISLVHIAKLTPLMRRSNNLEAFQVGCSIKYNVCNVCNVVMWCVQ